MAKNDSVVAELQKRIARLEKNVAILSGETAGEVCVCLFFVF
jgi:hypothetical protein